MPANDGGIISNAYVFRSRPTIRSAIRLARLLTPIGALAAVATIAPPIR